MKLDKLRKDLAEAMDAARADYEANGRPDYDAGRYEGLKQALEVVDRFLDRQTAIER